MSTKKLNEALGINDIDGFLSDLDVKDDIKQFDDIDEQVRKNADEIDTQIQEYKENGVQGVNFTNIQTSLKEIRELIDISKDTIRHVYEQIVSSELCDPDAVQALGKILEATHLTVSEYINLYKDRLAFYDKVKFEQIKHSHDMEKIKYKHELDMKKLESKQVSQTIDMSGSSSAYSQEDIIKSLDLEK
jgi:hypothetical protein